MRREQTDPAFCQFENLAYGWRAAFKLLTRTYYHTYRLFTIRAIVGKWAPPNENNTRAYVENVSRLTGIEADEPLGIPSESPARWIALGAAMAIQENGITSIDWFAMLQGWEMARNMSRDNPEVNPKVWTVKQSKLSAFSYIVQETCH